MRQLYIECNMGAAGDMLMSALTELLPEPLQEEFIARMNALGLDGVTLVREKTVKGGISGTHIDVRIAHSEHSGHSGHSHHSPRDITALIDSLPLSEEVMRDAREVYALITNAEAKVHGRPVELVHLHEVGALDAIADVTGVCLLMREYVKPDCVTVSPVKLGSGTVKTRHGLMPVPAPATSLLLEGIPAYAGEFTGELCTPTGAALLRRFADDFGPMPQMLIEAVGYGMGTKDFPDTVNCVRAFLGKAAADDTAASCVAELSCQLDDMTPEAIGFAMDVLFENGALDVFTIPITMKKSRPGQLFTCICAENRADEFAKLILTHTSTLGVRIDICRRLTLERETVTLNTEYGPIRVKRSHGYGVRKAKPEYDDVAKAAKASGSDFNSVYEAVSKQL